MPEIMFDPTLLLSPHVFLLAILFKYEAFQSDNLNIDPDCKFLLPRYLRPGPGTGNSCPSTVQG